MNSIKVRVQFLRKQLFTILRSALRQFHGHSSDNCHIHHVVSSGSRKTIKFVIHCTDFSLFRMLHLEISTVQRLGISRCCTAESP